MTSVSIQNSGNSRAEQWRTVLNGLYGDFTDFSRKAVKKFDAEDIHRARVNCRKLITMIRILNPGGEPNLLALFKKSQKRLGKVRDTDVLIDAFRQKRKHAKKEDRKQEAKLLKAVIQRQKKKRRRYRNKMAEQLPGLIQNEIEPQWEALIRSGLSELIVRTNVNRVMRELETSFEQKKQAYKKAREEHGLDSHEALDALHQLRITSKELRYTAAAADFELDQKFHAHEMIYKDLQQRLGDINDIRVWLETIEGIGRKKTGASRKTWDAFIAGLNNDLHQSLKEKGIV